MKILIDAKNVKKIMAELDRVNGKAIEHTYNTFSEIQGFVDAAEKKLFGLVGALKYMPGATLMATSGGGPVANRYKYQRIVTCVKFERCATGWFLIGVERDSLYPNQSGGWRLTLTLDQDARAVSILRSKYNVALAELKTSEI